MTITNEETRNWSWQADIFVWNVKVNGEETISRCRRISSFRLPFWKPGAQIAAGGAFRA